ncbi:hypothetical protein [Kingella potus]|uniref:hypothetical protein n=1 Tax=Kingella potus TaxID=265175 RepID=UPI001FD09CF1|nr:hypothetical protein [Kingella potus]UOO99889.1 hypothetical protein LVJ84_07365 [Kingella potus]
MPIHLIASICLILYCVFYAANLRRARTAAILPAGCSGLAFSVEKSGWYSVWLHAPSAPAAAPPFALADTAGSRKNLLSALFHASFARSGGRETLLYYGTV